MKKLLACLLAFMLPCCALAESLTISWSMDVAPEGLSALSAIITESSASRANKLSGKLVSAIAEALNGFSARATVNLATERFLLTMNHLDLALFTLDGDARDGTLYYTSNWLPGLLLSMAADGQIEELADEFSKAISQLSYHDMLNRMPLQNLDIWASSLDRETEYGAFAGDAYAGEGICTTYRFDERDIAVLLESLLWPDRPDNFDPLLRYLGYLTFDDVNGLRDAFLASLHRTAMHNRYSYVLRAVDNGSTFMPIGRSLTVYEAGKQVATLSVGYREDSIDAVLGYGLRGENYYFSFVIDDANDHLIAVKLWQDPDKEGYYTASSNESANLLLTAVLSGADGNTDDHWTLRADMWGKAFQDKHIQAAMTYVETVTKIDWISSVSVDSLPVGTVNVSLAITDDLEPLETEGLHVIDVNNLSDEDGKLIDRALKRTAATLGFKLLKQFPIELLLTLFINQLF